MSEVVLRAYDPFWPARAARLLDQARLALDGITGSESFRYEHIGSTAFPHLAAKPIVDLQVRMPSLPRSDELADLLAVTDFVPARGARSDSPGVHRDTPRPGDEAAVALHDKRLFHAPEQHAGDRDYDDYTRAKSAFFDEFEPRMRAWARNRTDSG